MRILIAFLLIVTFQNNLFCQQMYVPYRVGNKFGLSDESGKVLLKPKFDIVKPEAYGTPYFIGYNLQDSVVLSSLIYKGKIIISNQHYCSYHLSNDLFTAIDYQLKVGAYSSNADFTEINHLYNIDGKKVINEDFKSIYIIDDFNQDKNPMSEVLVCTTDLLNKNTLFIYDTKSKSITKNYFTDAPYLDIIHNSELDYRDSTISFIYYNDAGKGKKITLNPTGKKIKLIATEDVGQLSVEERMSGDQGIDDAVMEPGNLMESPRPNAVGDSIILTIRKVIIKRSFYYKPKQIEEITILNEQIRNGDNYILSQNGKVGFVNGSDHKLIIPVKYDEILNAEFGGIGGGYILKNNGKYGLYIYGFPNSVIIEPVFDKIPLLLTPDYYKKDFALIKLYDENGKFFCYANKDGKLYYTPE